MKGIAFIFAIGGAAVGAAVSYFVTKDICDKKRDADLNDIRDMYEERISKIVRSKEALKEQEVLKDKMMKEMEKQDDLNHLDAQNKVTTDYTSYFKKVKTKDNKETDGIRFITESEAQRYCKDYELIGLSLYSDDVLIDDNTENIIEDYEPWIGKDGITSIKRDNDAESIYILNPFRKEIYDVTVIDKRFNGDDYGPVEIE